MAVVRVDDLRVGYNEARPDMAEERDGDAILFLHGVGSDKSVWDGQLEYFSKTRRAVALDYPGYGESDAPASDLDRAAITRYVFGAMKALKINRAHVVGLSMGGVIALEMWRQNPHRLTSMVLADTFAKHPQAEQIVARSLGAIETMSLRSFAEARVEAILMENASAVLKREVIETMARIDRSAYAWASVAVWTADYRSLLPSIKLPTLVVVGEHDGVTPRVLSEELRDGIRGAKLEVILEAAHLSNLENPQAFNLAVEKQLDSLKTRTSQLAYNSPRVSTPSKTLTPLASKP